MRCPCNEFISQGIVIFMPGFAISMPLQPIEDALAISPRVGPWRTCAFSRQDRRGVSASSVAIGKMSR